MKAVWLLTVMAGLAGTAQGADSAFLLEAAIPQPKFGCCQNI
jgi:hypothetical protein